METLYQRLQEIARFEGYERARNVDVIAVTGLSKGRVSQIRNAGNTTDLESETISRLTSKGWRDEWIRKGIGPKRIDQAASDDQHKVVIKDATQQIIANRGTKRPLVEAVTQLADKLDDAGLLKLHGYASCLIEEHSLSKANKVA